MKIWLLKHRQTLNNLKLCLGKLKSCQSMHKVDEADEHTRKASDRGQN